MAEAGTGRWHDLLLLLVVVFDGRKWAQLAAIEQVPPLRRWKLMLFQRRHILLLLPYSVALVSIVLHQHHHRVELRFLLLLAHLRVVDCWH